MRILSVSRCLIASVVAGCTALLGGCSYFSRSNSSGGTEATASRAAAAPVSDPSLVSKYDALANEILETRHREVAMVRSILEATYRDTASALGQVRDTLRSPDAAAARPAVEKLATLVAYIATEGDASVAGVRKRLIEGGHHFNSLTPSGGASGTHAGAQGHHGSQQAPGHHAPGHHAAGQQTPGQPPMPPVTTVPPEKRAAASGAPGQGQTPSGHHSAGAPPAGAPGHAAPGAGHAAPGTPGAGHHAGPEGHHNSEGAHHEGGGALIGYDPGYVVVSRPAKKALLDASRALARLSASPSSEAIEAEWKKVESICLEIGIAGKK